MTVGPQFEDVDVEVPLETQRKAVAKKDAVNWAVQYPRGS